MIKQILFSVCALAGLAVAMVGLNLTSHPDGFDQLFSWLLPLLEFSIFAPFAEGFRRSRRQKQDLRNSFDQQDRLSENFPFILYLRSFRDDDPNESAKIQTFLPGHQTGEQLLVKELIKPYPGHDRFRVLAVGSPDEELPPLGCTRYRFSNQDWEQQVEALMRKASAVLLRPGITASVLWETEKLIRCLPPQRVYVLARPWGDHAATGYESWLARVARLFRHPLPAPENAPFLIGFDDDWKPTHGAVNEEPMLQRLASQAVAPSVRWMLKRITRRRRLSTPPPLPIRAHEPLIARST